MENPSVPKNCCLEGNLAQIREGLLAVRNRDKNAENQRKHLLWASLCTFFCSFFFPPLFLVVGVLFIARWRLASSDVEDHRYELPTRLLDLISLDLDPKKSIRLQLELRPANSKPFIYQSNTSTYPRLQLFRQEWLDLSVQTLDGHRLRVVLTRQGSYKYTPKRKRTKSKLRYSDTVTVSLRAPNAPEIPGRSEVPKKHEFRQMSCQVTATGAVVKASGPVYWVISNRATRTGGRQLLAADLLAAMVTAFRALEKPQAASTPILAGQVNG